MNTIIFQKIRLGVIFCVALFAFTGEVFAAPALHPALVVDITSTSAVLRGYAESYSENSVVWFEWSEGASILTPTTIAMRNFYGSGLFEAHLDRLVPGMTYSFRAVAKGGGVTVYSPSMSFKTKGGVPSGAALLGATNTSPNNLSQNNSANSGQASSGDAQLSTVATTKKSVSVATVTNGTKKLTTTPVTAGSTTNRNTNTAAVINAGGGAFPETLIGWVALVVAVLIAVLVLVMIFETTEKRKKKLSPLRLETDGAMV